MNRADVSVRAAARAHPQAYARLRKRLLASCLAIGGASAALPACVPAHAQAVDIGVRRDEEPAPDTTRSQPKRGISIGGFAIPLGRRETSAIRDQDVAQTVQDQLVFSTNGDPTAAAAAAGLDLVEATPLQSLGTTLALVRLRKGDSLAAAQGRLALVPEVSNTQPNHVFQTMADSAAPVPKRFVIHGLSAPEPIGRIDDGTIAMIDTVVAPDHEALRGARLQQQNFTADPTPRAHGTAVASLIAGTSADVQGVARGARLLNFAAFTERKDGIATATTASLAKALDAAAIAKPDVLNLAFGGRDDPMLRLLVDEIDRRGVCIVAAAGNGGAQRQVPFPATHPAALAVTAIDNALKPYAHATRGARIDIAAVGVDVFVAVPDGKRSGYRRMSGTSMATALVAGALMRMPECRSQHAPRAMRTHVRAAARDLGATGHDPLFGSGLFLLPEKKSQSP
jgi:subtilisin family serine protease